MTDVTERTETKLAKRALREGLKARSGIGVANAEGRSTVIEYLRTNPEFFGQIASGLDQLVEDYNKLTITDKNKGVLIASARLKAKLPHLPTLEEMYSEFGEKRTDSTWMKNFLGAIKTMDKAMSAGEALRKYSPNQDLLNLDTGVSALLFHLSETHPRALFLGEAYHAYEETVLQDNNVQGKRKFRKDEIVDALIEMLVENHQDSPLLPITRDPWSLEGVGGLNWIDNYDHLSIYLRKKAGCS